MLDASIPVAAALPDESEGDVARQLMAEAADRGVAVPALWPTELANALLVSVRRDRIAAEAAMHALQRLAPLTVEIDPPDPAVLWSAALMLAFRHGLTVYDAAYLELALRLRLPLASFDRKLRAAAAAESVALLP